MIANKVLSVALSALLCSQYCVSYALAGTQLDGSTPEKRMELKSKMQSLREEAAARRKEQGSRFRRAMLAPNPGGTPDYFNVPNWANSPLPTVNGGIISGGIRKFVDTLPGVGSANANNLGQYIPVAIADKTTFSGSDYYQIGLVDYRQQMHSDLPATKLRGYIDLAPGSDGKAHYLGPLIIAQKDRPVRVKFTNMLPTGAAGNLFIPVDTTVMGAGDGPVMAMGGGAEPYTQNRATLHMHGGDTPWISDGTAHQWTAPAGEMTSYPKGVSTQDVPDMPASGEGAMTFYYPNGQSSRLMFYHDHAYGITRLNVYAGEAAGYLLTDPVEESLINSGALPDLGGVYRYGVPLIIQDKTFVPPASQLTATDPTWDTAKWGGFGDLWFPHVYMPNQNPADAAGINPFGRWDYGPWFWPPVTNLKHPPVGNTPATPNVSMVMESFMDTPLVNGTAYPVMPVQRRAYRFRVLNACNDRFLNLQLYYADPANPTEVKMIPAIAGPTIPSYWPTMDMREGGVPDPTMAGPEMIQIGTEGGFLTAPAVRPNIPIGYDMDRRSITVLNVKENTLLLGPAERADVIIDFSGVPDGAKIILYNDAPAPVPAADPRLDYYTGGPDMTATGGAPSTLPGYGPNTRTIMQFQASGPASASFNLAALQAAWPAAYAAAQPPFPVPAGTYARIHDNFMIYTPPGGSTAVTTQFKSKAIQELFELDYGRMNSTLGVELPLTNLMNQTTIPYGYIDPATEIIKNGETQLWKITHNGVDTHAVHFHLFNVQLVNRVDWAGVIKPPESNELGWKETLRMNPLEDVIVALRPITPSVPFELPDSIRPMDPTMPLGSKANFVNVDPATGFPVTITNIMYNFGHEYVWHCHLLGHEEMDMMRPVIFQDKPGTPKAVTATAGNGRVTVNFLPPPTGGSPITLYTVTAAPGGITATGASNPVTVTGLTNGTAYTFTVTATNAVGTGPVSASSNSATPQVSLVAPSSLQAINITNNSVSLRWRDNSNNEQGFYVERSSNGGAAWTQIGQTGANATSFRAGGLARRTRYMFRVRAFNAGSVSGYSNTLTATTR